MKTGRVLLCVNQLLSSISWELYRHVLAPFIKHLDGSSCLCWPASLCGLRPFVQHVQELLQMSADWLLCPDLILFVSSVVALPLSGSPPSIWAKIRSGRCSCTLRIFFFAVGRCPLNFFHAHCLGLKFSV